MTGDLGGFSNAFNSARALDSFREKRICLIFGAGSCVWFGKSNTSGRINSTTDFKMTAIKRGRVRGKGSISRRCCGSSSQLCVK
jgi:hypothetical protein